MDKSGANKAAIDQINESMEMPMIIRQVKDLYNIVGQDHRAVKRITKPMRDLKSFNAARSVLAGVEFMHMIRKRQTHFSGSEEIPFADHFLFWQGKFVQRETEC